jgi:hypothetical protein
MTGITFDFDFPEEQIHLHHFRTRSLFKAVFPTELESQALLESIKTGLNCEINNLPDAWTIERTQFP